MFVIVIHVVVHSGCQSLGFLFTFQVANIPAMGLDLLFSVAMSLSVVQAVALISLFLLEEFLYRD